jgi:hypothetical protein
MVLGVTRLFAGKFQGAISTTSAQKMQSGCSHCFSTRSIFFNRGIFPKTYQAVTSVTLPAKALLLT